MRRVIYSDPFTFARWLSDKLRGVGCSESYIEEVRRDLMRRVAAGEIEVRE